MIVRRIDIWVSSISDDWQIHVIGNKPPYCLQHWWKINGEWAVGSCGPYYDSRSRKKISQWLKDILWFTKVAQTKLIEEDE